MRRFWVWGFFCLLACGCGGSGTKPTEAQKTDGPSAGPVKTEPAKKSATEKVASSSIDPMLKYLGKPLRDWAEDLQSADAQKKQSAVLALAAVVGPEAKAITPLLKEALKDSDPYTRAGAARALAQIAPVYPETVKVLVEDGLLNDQQIFRLQHVEPLRKHGKLAVPALLPLLKDSRPEIQQLAIQLIGEIGADAHDATPVLLELAKLPPPAPARELARRALGQIKADPKTVLPILIEMAKADANAGLPTSAAFAAIATYGSEGASAVPFLTEALKTEKNRLPYATTLLRLEPENRDARKEVIGYLESPIHRQVALDELVRNGRPAIPDLLEALRNRNRLVREAAGEALRRIDPAEAKKAGV